MHTLIQRIVKVNIELKPDAFLWGLIDRLLGKGHETLVSKHDKCSKIIACTKVKTSGITHNGGTFGEDEGTEIRSLTSLTRKC